MKKIFLTLLFAVLFTNSYAQALTAKSVEDMLKKIEASEFTYQGHALAYGYFSIESCLYTSKDFAILKNYCYPAKSYPAKGFTIISPEFGVVRFYQESLPKEIVKRDIELHTFSEDFAEYAGTPMADLSFGKINSIMEELYNKQPAACWSSNYSRYTSKPEVKCNQKAGNSVASLAAWGKETQAMSKHSKGWNAVLARLNAAIKKVN